MSGTAMMDVKEFAGLIGLSAYTVREKARNGEFKFARKIGRDWRFNREKALKFAGVEGVKI